MSNIARSPIRILPKDLAEKIAAGEVVERPGSVIKELVENSLDANAKHIRIELEDGGKKKILIQDDGCGILEDEMLVALERHATSKISELDDLWNLSTMGFRGEALPSIAAVSRFTLESRAFDNDQGLRPGKKLYLEGGRVLKNEPLDPQSRLSTKLESGTVLTIEDLFFNVPARLKFLKSKSAETSYIRELIERLALCNPQVAFTLIADSRKLLQLPPARNFKSRVAEILEIKETEIEEFESQFEDITVRGWLDRNGRASNSRNVYLSVNGRMVRDKLLQQAALIGLRPRMMEGEYPKIYLAVDVNPNHVDVNVHPAKSEVRFHKAKDVFQVIHGSLGKLAKNPSQAFYESKLPDFSEKPAEAAQSPSTAADREEIQPTQERFFTNDRVSYKTKEFELPQEIKAVSPSQSGPVTVNSSYSTSPGFTRLHYIGQLKNTYLLFQDDNGLILIDQHAAHERINYERIKKDFLENGLNSQPLLISSIFKCRPEEVALALDHIDSFSKLGFEFEAFGESSLVIRSVPQGLPPERASELFGAVLSDIRDSETTELIGAEDLDPARLSPKLERLLATSACHSSVRAGQSLSPNEAKELANQMEETPSSLNCPHGRPASLRLTFSQIEGLFKRG